MPRCRIVNAADKKARLDIFDAIGETTDWWTGEKSGIAARDFSATLQALGELEEIELHINSPGSSVVDGWQIYNELRRNPARVHVLIDGEAAFMASVITMAGDILTMPENAALKEIGIRPLCALEKSHPLWGTFRHPRRVLAEAPSARCYFILRSYALRIHCKMSMLAEFDRQASYNHHRAGENRQ